MQMVYLSKATTSSNGGLTLFACALICRCASAGADTFALVLMLASWLIHIPSQYNWGMHLEVNAVETIVDQDCCYAP